MDARGTIDDHGESHPCHRWARGWPGAAPQCTQWFAHGERGAAPHHALHGVQGRGDAAVGGRGGGERGERARGQECWSVGGARVRVGTAPCCLCMQMIGRMRWAAGSVCSETIDVDWSHC
jgi:hypothetical protein